MYLDQKTVKGLDQRSFGNRADRIFFDEQLPGFGIRLRVAANGGGLLRSWIAQYRHQGRTRRHLLGNANVIGAEQARSEAKKILAKAQLGYDPHGDKVERRLKDKMTFAATVDQYVEARSAIDPDTELPGVRPNTLVAIKQYLRGDYFRPLHSLPLDAVNRKQVASCVVRIGNENGKAAASRASIALSTFYSWAMKRGLAESNPVANTERPKENPGRDRVLSDSEMAAIWKSCNGDDHGRIVRLLMLTGCRRAEIGGMCWSEFSNDGKAWTLPVPRSKNKMAHTLTLPQAALDIIATVPHRESRDQLFGLRGSAGFNRWNAYKETLDVRSGVKGWTLHDIRRSVATGLANMKVLPHIIEAALNHQSGSKRGVAGVYNRSTYTPEVTAALAKWSNHLTALAGVR